MAILTHFMAISGGVSWWEQFQILNTVGLSYAVVFVFYIVVMMIMLLNIVTGIFVNEAVEMAQRDGTLATQSALDENKHLFDELKLLFHRIDANGSGNITL